MPQNNNHNLWADRFTQFLLGILAVAFMTWAGIVWNATQTVSKLLYDLSGQVTAIADHVKRTDEDLRNHEALEAHPGALKMHTQELERLGQLQREMDEVREQHQRYSEEHERARR